MNRNKIFVITVLIGLSLSLSPAAQIQEESNMGINTLEGITLGGVKQWILLRGKNVSNPILLFLHGGPGFCMMPYSHVFSTLLEKHFIVVNWDQRGCGKSYNADIREETMNIAQYLSDTHELIQMLKTRFSKDKIFLIGHSWGSILGLYTAYRHPEDLHAYIGMGQVVNMKEGEMVSYNYTYEKAKAAGDESALEMLKKIDPPFYKGGFQNLSIQRMLLGRYGGAMRNLTYPELGRIRYSSPYYSKTDNDNFMSAFERSCAFMWDEMLGVNFFGEVPEVQIPVYFFTGRYDYTTPFELVERYFKVLKAPYKEIVWFEDSCHSPNLAEPEVFQDKLIHVVLKNTLKK